MDRFTYYVSQKSTRNPRHSLESRREIWKRLVISINLFLSHTYVSKQNTDTVFIDFFSFTSSLRSVVLNEWL